MHTAESFGLVTEQGSSETDKHKLIIYCLIPVLLFAISLGLRLYFFQGFVLGDDAEEIANTQNIAQQGLRFGFQGPLGYRFSTWIFNAILFRVAGTSEATFFLPTLLISASFSVLGYFILLKWGYDRLNVALAGLFIAAAPFEILIGSVRANDLILSWFLALGMVVILYLEKRPFKQGVFLGLLFWLAFYTKLWVVYALPAVGLYFWIQYYYHRRWHAFAMFVVTSVVLHSATSLLWKWKLGTFFPFFSMHSATYPVLKENLASTFLLWPNMIIHGSSEFGTSLFGLVPYLLFALLGMKTIIKLMRVRHNGWALDGLDLFLLFYYVSFFILLNFFPQNFKFDQFYSVPRIFRYLTPLSFPIVLHTAKMLLDFGSTPPRIVGSFKAYLFPVAVIPILILCLVQAVKTARPGWVYRQALVSVADDIKKKCPPMLLVEGWVGDILEEGYLKPRCSGLHIGIKILPLLLAGTATEHERWLSKEEPKLPEGTLLVTGLGSYLYYGCNICGFHLRLFTKPLSNRWTMVKEYNMLSYLPQPEPARLWRLSEASASESEVEPVRMLPIPIEESPESLFQKGKDLFDKSDFPGARVYFSAIMQKSGESMVVQDAYYFNAVSYWREKDNLSTIRECKKLLERFPQGRWSAVAHYHIGLSYKDLGDTDQARAHFNYVLKNFSSDTYVANLAKDRLAELPFIPLSERLRCWFLRNCLEVSPNKKSGE